MAKRIRRYRGRGGNSDRTPAGSVNPPETALVTPGFGWVLTADDLLLTSDGGATFTIAKVPIPATEARAAFFRDARHGYVTASTGDALLTATTADGGRTWRTGALRDSASPAAQYGRLRMMFGDASHGAILAQTSTSAMSSRATLFATADGGTTWSARPAPASGELSMERGGRIWLAGGVAHDELHSTSDLGRHWSRSRLDVAGTAVSTAVSPPRDGVVAATVVTETDRTEVAILTTPDKGRTWRETGWVAVRGRTGPGVRVPVATAGAGAEPLVLDTAGAHAYRMSRPGRAGTGRTTAGTAAAPGDVAAGLPEGTHTVTFAADGRTGWALATYGRCADGKSACTLYRPLMTTVDGGAGWRQVRLWAQRLN